MAFNDFKITKFNGNTDNGTAVLHSSLSNPITGAGDFCRGFNADPFNRSIHQFIFSVSSSYNNSSLIGIQSNKSISIRAMIRCEAPGTAVGSLYSKGPSSKISDDFPSHLNVMPRYSLILNTSQLNLQCGGYRAGHQPAIEVLNGLQNNQWYRIRMDIIPVTAEQIINGVLTTSDYKDVINIYTGSGPVGSETWGKIYTKEILTTDVEYVPWGNYISPGGSGGYTGTVTSSVGFIINGQNTGVYIDQFQVYTASL